jgi:hypothetical protein
MRSIGRQFPFDDLFKVVNSMLRTVTNQMLNDFSLPGDDE